MKPDPAIHDLPFVSIILPVYNEERYLALTLEQLKRVYFPREKYEIITVDNGSTDDSFRIARKYADKSYVLKNVNVGAVRNFGVQHAKGPVIAFLDSDCLVPENWIICGVTKLISDESLVLGGNLYLRDNPSWIEKYWLLDNKGSETMQKDLLGSCIFIRKTSFEAAGGFDETITSGEDTALSNQLKALGNNVVIDPQLGVVHLGNPQTVFEFLKRQVWHAENYFLVLGEALKDKVFLLVLVYLAGYLGLIGFVFGIPLPSITVAAALLGPPAVLSIKRIIRAKFRPLSIAALAAIYCIDHLYLVGRATGLLRGLVKILKKDSKRSRA